MAILQNPLTLAQKSASGDCSVKANKAVEYPIIYQQFVIDMIGKW